MPIETDSNDKVVKLAEMGNSDALAELGIRYLGGIFGNARDAKKAKYFLKQAAAAGNKTAEKVLSAADTDNPDDEVPAMMLALAEIHRDSTLENDQIPGKAEEAERQKKLGLFWYYSAVDLSYLPALYSLADFYYMMGGSENNERASVLFCTCAGIEGGYADKAVDRLYLMLTRGWLSESWNCYSDVLFILENYSGHDVSEYTEAFDSNAEVDDITGEKLFAEPHPYPLEAENNAVRRYGNIRSKRDVQKVLLGMGIKISRRVEGVSCRIPLSGNRENTEKLRAMGYRVTEGVTGYTVYEKDENRAAGGSDAEKKTPGRKPATRKPAKKQSRRELT